MTRVIVEVEWSENGMCILMVVYNKVRDYPVVLAANRDEYLDRPAVAPHLLWHAPPVWGGQDKHAGGTWLGVNGHGVVIGLTNRRMSADQKNDLTRPSRGLLCLSALQHRTPARVVAFLRKEPDHRYNPFNLLVVDKREAFWIAYDGTPEVCSLEAGVHILANGNINDLDTVRIRRARVLLEGSEEITLRELLPLLERVCQDHETGVCDRDTICMHRPTENYGTVSSTIIALPADQQKCVYRYAEGYPCINPYQDYVLPFLVSS